MPSLVTEVLLQAGKLDKEDLCTKVSKLSSQSAEIKTKIFNYVHSNFGEAIPMFLSLPAMLQDIRQQQNEAKDIQSSLIGTVKTQLQDSTGEFEQLTKELAETNELLSVMGKICNLCDLHDSQGAEMGKANMKEAANSLLKMQELLGNIKESNLMDLQVFKFLSDEYVIVLENFIYTIQEQWASHVYWVLPEKMDEHAVLYLPNLESDNGVGASLQDLVTSMSMLERLKPKVNKLADMVLKHILKPLIEDSSLQPDLDDDYKSSGKARKVSLKRLESKYTQSRLPSTLFKQVLEILECMNTGILRLSTGANTTIMQIFSSRIKDEVIQSLIDNCLVATVPQNRDELMQYKSVENTITLFESALVRVGFMQGASQEDNDFGPSLVTFAMNVSVHFASRRCTDILQEARNLMKKGMQNTRVVDNKELSDIKGVFLEKGSSVAVKKNMPIGTDFDSQKPGKLLSDETMHFPKCQVSECAIAIIELVINTMKEVRTSSPDCAIRLVATAQNIIELYQTAFPIYHKDELENIPRQSAIFYNDCMYIAHNLLTLGHQFASMSEYTKKAMQVMTFVDKVPYLRRLGAEVFIQQLKYQNKMIIQCLEPFHSFATLHGQDKFAAIEKSLKQVLYQLNHLRKVWIEVLPNHTLLKALGTLVNNCITEVVSTVCGMEDISSDDSVSLRLACELLLHQTPSVFQATTNHPDLTWRKQVSKWPRLEELIFMLSSSLREIVDRWADGKGPLASAFSVVEVKCLIRALFQNTEHRAQAISKIRI